MSSIPIKITVIREIDPFVVDFTQQMKINSLNERVDSVAFAAFVHIKYFAASLMQGIYISITNAHRSFLHSVIGVHYINGRIHLRSYPNTLTLFFFRVFFWGIGLIFSVVLVANRKYHEKTSTKLPSEMPHKSDALDGRHFRSNNRKIVLSPLAENVQIEDLTGILTCKPSDNKEKLLQNLNTFIANVRGRVAFIGTPRAEDITQLESFYDRIEKSIQFSLYTARKRLEDFEAEHPNPLEDSPDDKKQRQNFQEDIEKVAYDCAIAGGFCGGRYMGESSQLYDYFSGTLPGAALTLEESLIKILADKRLEIAKKDIANSPNAQNTHQYSAYMSALGETLGLPGTEGIYEQLASIDQEEMLRIFFQSYTPNCIINTVQQEIQKNQTFRELLITWLQDQASDWVLSDQDQWMQKLTDQVTKILGSKQLNPEEKRSQIAGSIQRQYGLPCAPDVVGRLIKGELTKEAFVQHVLLARKKDEFIAAFHFVDDETYEDLMARDGISPELMEWILVSHGIFLPQMEEGRRV